MTPQQIESLLASHSENENLEFKEAKTQMDRDKLYEYCVAIANEGGGHLVLGVSDTRPRRVVGTKAFANPVSLAEKLFEAIGFRVEVEVVEHPDGRVLLFHIPSRPRGTAFAVKGKYLMRVGESLTPMSADQLRRIFDEGRPDWLEQHALSECSAQDVIQLLDTQAFFDLLRLPYPTDRRGVLEKLIAERLIEDQPAGFGISKIIIDTIDAGWSKLDPNAPSSKKYARYLPIWA